MQCSIHGCPGRLEPKRVVHTVRHRGHVVVIDNVPAEVCNVCGDVLLAPETVRHIERILSDETVATSTVPLYQYA